MVENRTGIGGYLLCLCEWGQEYMRLQFEGGEKAMPVWLGQIATRLFE